MDSKEDDLFEELEKNEDEGLIEKYKELHHKISELHEHAYIQKQESYYIEEQVNEINTNFDSESKAIQYASIPIELKKKLLTIDFSKSYKNDELQKRQFQTIYNEYNTWIKTTFFNNRDIIFEMNISNENDMYIEHTKQYLRFYDNYHREFNKQNPNTHLIIYYPNNTNCLSNCGTSIKYIDKNSNEWRYLSLLTNDDLVYCIRDCCFLHKTPTSIPFEIGPEISRTLIRSYVRLKDGPEYEESLFPSEQDRPEFSYVIKRGGNKIKKRKSRKYRKNKKTKKKSRKYNKTKTKS